MLPEHRQRKSAPLACRRIAAARTSLCIRERCKLLLYFLLPRQYSQSRLLKHCCSMPQVRCGCNNNCIVLLRRCKKCEEEEPAWLPVSAACGRKATECPESWQSCFWTASCRRIEASHLQMKGETSIRHDTVKLTQLRFRALVVDWMCHDDDRFSLAFGDVIVSAPSLN